MTAKLKRDTYNTGTAGEFNHALYGWHELTTYRRPEMDSEQDGITAMLEAVAETRSTIADVSYALLGLEQANLTLHGENNTTRTLAIARRVLREAAEKLHNASGAMTSTELRRSQEASNNMLHAALSAMELTNE